MASWVGQAVHRGILTTQYPLRPAGTDEVPATSREPTWPGAAPLPVLAVASCPVGALEVGAVDQGRCIRCARCLGQGLRFDGPAEASTSHRADLVQKPGSPAAASGTAPLAGFGRSLHVFLVDVGSCNACNLEVLALANPFYDSQRLGIFFTNSPRHADVLVVVGVPTDAMVEPVRRAYEAMPSPKAVVAVGVCPISGGVFRGNPGLHPSLDGIVPVDRFVPGCPPTPVQVLDALLQLIGRSRPREV